MNQTWKEGALLGTLFTLISRANIFCVNFEILWCGHYSDLGFAFTTKSIVTPLINRTDLLYSSKISGTTLKLSWTCHELITNYHKLITNYWKNGQIYVRNLQGHVPINNLQYEYCGYKFIVQQSCSIVYISVMTLEFCSHRSISSQSQVTVCLFDVGELFY